MLEDLFLELQRTNELIRFANTYRGMPVNNSGKVVRVSPGLISFQVSRVQILCMRRDHYTFIKSSRMPHMYRAKFIGMDWHKEIVHLWDFTLRNDTIGSRALVRVEPNDLIPAIVIPEGSNESMAAKVVEVSVKGVAVVLNDISQRSTNISKGNGVFVEYHLPLQSARGTEIATIIGYGGVVRNILPSKTGLTYRIGVQVYPDSNTERIITKYIAQRQMELLKEIREMSNEEPMA
jgi:hypothetical protein